jgi:hypothetical protein
MACPGVPIGLSYSLKSMTSVGSVSLVRHVPPLNFPATAHALLQSGCPNEVAQSATGTYISNGAGPSQMIGSLVAVPLRNRFVYGVG